MTTSTTRRAFRTAVVTVALALATTVGASADVLTPLEDTGGPGGGGGYGGQLDETARAHDLQALTADSAVAQHPSQNAKSIQRHESLYTENGVLAGGETDAPQATSPHITF